MNAKQALSPARRPVPLEGLITVMLVLGTHYDLAWQHQEWLIRHQFQRFMSQIVSALERNPSLRFSLDGQAILALWWLRDVSHTEATHRRQRLRNLVRRGQLEIGPALVIPDEFLAPEMALLMNLVIGKSVTSSFGAPPQRFYDMSDTFGHVAQMVQLMRSFADFMLFSRGLGAKDVDLTMFEWRSPDGSSMTAIPQQGGYQSGSEIGRHDIATSVRIIEDFFAKYGERYEKSNLTELLIYLRGDYKGLPDHLDEHLQALRRRFPNVNFVLGSNAEYIERIRTHDLSGLPVRTGELAGSADLFILRGVNSMRMELKLLNELVYRTIVAAGTAASLAMLKRGASYYYPRHAMTRIWSDFLVLQSHDAITGCHSDQVFQDMVVKYRALLEEADWLKQEALAALAGRTAVPNHDNRVGHAPTAEFGLLNLLSYRRSEVVLVPLPPKLRGVRKLRAFVEGREVEVQRVARNFAALPISTGSFGSVGVKLEQNTHAEEAVNAEEGVISNEFLRVQAADNGTLTITDLLTGRVYPSQHLFQSEGDGGDTYTFAPVADPAYDSRDEQATVVLVSRGPLVSEMEISVALHLPKHLDRRTRTHRVGSAVTKVKTLIRLRRGSRQVEFETTVFNKAEDHRLRVVFPLPEKLRSSRAQSAFMVAEYPVRAALDPHWKEKSQEQEPPFNAITNHGLVVAGPLFLANRGITEYEARHTAGGTELCLTLLRCVSHLSQGDLVSRRGQAGPGNVRVPLAQCLKKEGYTFSYTLGLVGETTDIELAQAAQAWRYGFEPTYADVDTNGLIDCDPGQSVFASLMPAPDGKSVRLMQWAGAEPTHVELSGKFRVPGRVELNGKPSSAGNRIAPFKIATFSLRRLH